MTTSLDRYIYRFVLLLALLFVSHSILYASDEMPLVPPVKIPIYLSGNFAEFRSEHFHSGIDIKTQGRTGIPIHAIADGYISRIGVSPVGYGNALYLTHPNGTTSVYGHLERFAPAIAAFVEELQYSSESFGQSIYLEEGEIAITMDEVIAYSGNSGSSGGPHLHFEIRDTESEEPLNPLHYYRKLVVDRTKPVVREVALFPLSHPFAIPASPQHYPVQGGNGNYHLADTLEAWGNIGLGIRANDYMDGVRNTFGVYTTTLVIEGDTLFSITLDRLNFDDNIYMNSLIDYPTLVNNRYFLMKSHKEPNNALPRLYTHLANRGVININQERLYSCQYLLNDLHGNKSTVQFYIKGTKAAIENTPVSGSTPLSYYLPHYLQQEEMRLYLPSGALATSIVFDYSVTPSGKGYHSPLHHLGSTPVALLKKGVLKIEIPNDTLTNKCNYYLARIVRDKATPIIGSYIDGLYSAYITKLGTYAIATDTTAPTIAPLAKQKWSQQGVIRIQITDKESGIATFRGEIDGIYALFEYDAKRAALSYKIDSNRLERGKEHQITIHATDKCGNSSTYSTTLNW